MIIDPVGRQIISGIHRHETGKAPKEYILPDGFIEELAEKLGVTRDMMVVIIRQHLNIQRQVKEEKTKEELGLDCDLNEIAKFVSPKWKIGQKIEWEFIMVFETTVSHPQITLSDETQEGRFTSLKEFKKLIAKEPGKFTPDILLAVQHYPRMAK